jgi:hypothetical protein
MEAPQYFKLISTPEGAMLSGDFFAMGRFQKTWKGELSIADIYI